MATWKVLTVTPLAVAAVATVVLQAAAQPVVMDHLKPFETAQAAKLTAVEMTAVVEELDKTSFDTPESWDAEARVRRVTLGAGVDGLVVQGSKLLCGATGNCQTWVFRAMRGRWKNLLRDQAPLADAFGFQGEVTRGVRNLVLDANVSAAVSRRTIFAFDGSSYPPRECFDVETSGSAINLPPAPCQSGPRN